ncbi:putative GAG protein [Labeo rohita]|uniref:Putative GAG protein n=1 Tax=Labeo rohita TaxID=84645 RepID=A0A498MYN4_LABRO|nr:putative GAG protein [Labeo rohita]RXN37946.1 putative GAG protein [Labeo rohita]
MGDTARMMRHRRPPGAQHLSIGLTSPIRRSLKMTSSGATSRSPTNRPVMTKTWAFLGSASVHQAAYKSSALSVRTLNVSSLLSAYQAELLDDLGQQLDKGSPSLSLCKEILTVNDLVLRNARQAIQACGRSMALSVVGERALWLNLSGLPDSEKRRIAGAPVEPGQTLFGPVVALMQQRCDEKKKEDNWF